MGEGEMEETQKEVEQELADLDGQAQVWLFFKKWSLSLSQIYLRSLSLSKPHQPDSERGGADGKSEVSSGADNLGFEGQQPTSANDRVNQNARHLSGSIVSFAKFFIL